MDPIHQFEVTNYFVFAHIGGAELAFTRSALFMLISLALIALLMIGATGSRAMVPGRLQSVAEGTYEFVASMLENAAGPEAMKFFPLVFSIFMFVLAVNLIGLIPYAFAVTAQIIITVSLALLVFLTVIVYGLRHNGVRFFRLFVPSGAPVYILPLLVPIEVLSFFTRPVSHSLRLFANILAGHITLKVFAGFVTMLSAFGFLGWAGAILPLSMTVALTALELLVAVLQAYVFAILTCIYLKDAIHPGH
ncbi:MAG TPA: F0F1 ATP synthase subunit A [Xanthobacteraceae bacterium]|nr:F0F1 ATP synthase subunit A [Xanthobacteraceae bacterium]